MASDTPGRADRHPDRSTQRPLGVDPRAARAGAAGRGCPQHPGPQHPQRPGPQRPQTPGLQRRGARGQGRSRTSLSLETIVEAAITTLDRDGAEKLTLRSLAAELGSGVASLYWYASGKDELMAIVADELLGRALTEAQDLSAEGRVCPADFDEYPAPQPAEQTSEQTAHALTDIRRLVLCLFMQMLEHRWLAAQLIKAGPDQNNSLMYWERIGQALQRMELTSRQQFHASLAIVNYASGMGAEISQGAIDREGMDDVEAEFAAQMEHWGSHSVEEFPFVHSVLDEFMNFDDRSEFIAGLDLVLSGVERLTWG